MINIVDYENTQEVTLNVTEINKSGADNISNVPGLNTPSIDASISVVNIPDSGGGPDIAGWSTGLVFTATDSDTVSRGSGSIVLANGTSYSISSGNTGNMSNITYIYLDLGVSTTILQTTTTPATSVGAGKILVCVAKNTTSPSFAQFQAFGTLGNGVFITADNIAANTITANQIAANTITANKMSVSTLSAISANLGTITAGTVTGATIRTAAQGNKRVELSTSYFQCFDSSDNLCGTISGDTLNLGGLGSQQVMVIGGSAVNYISADAWNVLAAPFTYTGALKVFPSYSNVNIGDAGAGYNNIYINGSIDFDNGDGVFSEISGTPRWNNGTSYGFVISDGTTSTSSLTAAGKLTVNIAGTTFKLLYSN